MHDVQIATRTRVSNLNAKVPLGLLRNAVPLSAVAYKLANERLRAQNTRLQSALEHQRTKATDLRSILCSMDVATLCVCRALKLRLFTAAAGHLFGIGPEDVGFTLSLSGPFGADETLTARIKAVLESGIGEETIVALAPDHLLLCRLLLLLAFEAADPAVDGVIITFATTHDAAVALPAINIQDHDMTSTLRRSGDALTVGHAALGCNLTRRQRQVLDHVLAGHPSKNIAADLGISQRTVENHRAAIMARTGATSLPAPARLAIGADVGGDCNLAPLRRVCA